MGTCSNDDPCTEVGLTGGQYDAPFGEGGQTGELEG
jgi:hypothetical protein